MQTDVSVADGAVSGTLKYITTGSLVDEYGEGYFVALKWTDPDAHATSLKVGLDPSEGTGLIECIDDTDRNGVFKVTNPSKQKFIVMQSGAGYATNKQKFDLSGLEFEEA